MALGLGQQAASDPACDANRHAFRARFTNYGTGWTMSETMGSFGTARCGIGEALSDAVPGRPLPLYEVRLDAAAVGKYGSKWKPIRNP